jgi:hypothetical protein
MKPAPSDTYSKSFDRRPRPTVIGALQNKDGDGTSGGMDQVWAKLNEHDKRFDRVEDKLDRIETDVGGLKGWILGTAAATIFFTVSCALALLGLVYAARQDTTAVMGTALSAIQSVIAAKQSEPAAAPTPPTVIIVPGYAQPPTQKPGADTKR